MWKSLPAASPIAVVVDPGSEDEVCGGGHECAKWHVRTAFFEVRAVTRRKSAITEREARPVILGNKNEGANFCTTSHACVSVQCCLL